MDAVIKTYGKNELAELYEISFVTFKLWLKTSIELWKDLHHFGYDGNQKKFTVKQVELIFQHLLPPEAPKLQEQFEAKKAKIKPYGKSEIASMFGWNVKTLLVYMQRVIPKSIYDEIFTVADVSYRKINYRKRIFNSNDVKIIFFWLGHPYILEKSERKAKKI